MGQRGPKPGSGGRPKKPIAEKIAAGNPGKRKLTVIDFDNKAADLDGETMPKPSEFLSATQKDGTQLCAVEIYEATWKWLNDRGCSHLISPQMIERYAMASARWIQCDAVEPHLGRDFPDCPRKLHDGIRRYISTGRCYGAASYRSERELICMKK